MAPAFGEASKGGGIFCGQIARDHVWAASSGLMPECRAHVVYVALLLSLPAVATLQLPAHAAEPGPRSRRAQQQQLSRGDVLRGALAAAATWVSPCADLPLYCTYRLRVPAACVPCVLAAPGSVRATVPASAVPYAPLYRVVQSTGVATGRESGRDCAGCGGGAEGDRDAR